jgi:two-component system, NarL family, invasion response regulator UvrY
MGKSSVVIIDDHAAVRAGLRAIIDTQSDMHVVGEANSGEKALSLLSETTPEVVLLDLHLGDMSGIDVLRQLKEKEFVGRVLILSGYAESQFGINALRAGAKGFINKNATAPEVLRAIRSVMRGGRYIGAILAEQLVARVDGNPDAPLHESLSSREFEVFRKLAEGETVSGVAAKLFLSVKTVSTYRRRILDKMAMKSNAELTTYAMRNELIQ